MKAKFNLPKKNLYANFNMPDSTMSASFEMPSGSNTTNIENYDRLENKPSINGVELTGNKTTADLGLATAEQGVLAETALQEIPSYYVTETELTNGLSTKQNVINDLSEIREGASLGATSLQPNDISDMATMDWVNEQGYTSNAVKSVNGNLPDSTGNVVIEISDSGLDDKQDKLTAGTDLEILNGSPLHNLPSGYTELEYVQSSGTQYLDTGVAFKDGIRVEVDFQYISLGGTAYTFGFNDYLGYLFYVSNGVYTINSSQSINYSASIYNKTHISATFTATNNIPTITATIGDETKTFTRSNSGGSLYNLQIFTASGQANYASTGRCYGVKVYDNDVLVMELVPAIRTSDNKVGMYDTVGNTFKTNSGTGNLIASAPAVEQTIINFTNESGYIKSGTTANVSALKIGNTTLSEAQLQSLLNLI